MHAHWFPTAYCWLSLQDPNCVNVADWFQAFRDVHQQQEQQQQVGAGGSSGGGAAPKRRAAVKQSKKRKKQQEEEEAAAAGGSGGAPAGDGQLAGRAQQEVVARFMQATAELQLVGLIKPTKRRRGTYVQRLVHMPAQGF